MFGCQQPQSAFTLIEVVISSALMAMIIVSSYLCFSAAIAGRKSLEPRLEVIQNARVAMALMTADLRAACPLGTNAAFLGMHRTSGDVIADNLDFATHNYTPKHPREGDFCQMSYYLDRDPDAGGFKLWRRRNPTIALDPLSGGSKEEIASGVLGLQFEYFDGLDWYDTWGDITGKAQTSQRDQPNLAGMPEAVRITIWFSAEPRRKNEASPEDRPREENQPRENQAPENQVREEQPREATMVFQTVARLNLASASSSGGSSGSGDSNGGEPSQGGSQ
jgi:prepilin-type N-terminal cleavage/methylation domain-containing protein